MATAKKARAWIPATVTTLLVVLSLFGSGLLYEILEDRGVDALADPDSAVGAYVYRELAPVGTTGLVGAGSFGDAIARFGGGLVPVVILVFLFTWLAARAARAGSAFTVLLGAWLGTVLGVGLGGLASFQVFIWQEDLGDSFVGLQATRVSRIGTGLYWGAVAGLVIGLIALLTWLIARPRAEEPLPEEPPDSGPPDVTTYPPPPKHAGPASGTSDETIRAPEPPPPNL